jgi:hypothetical protein
LSGHHLTLGTQFTWEHAGWARSSETQANWTGDKRVLDVYGTCAFTPTTRLRLTVANLLAQDTAVRNLYVAPLLDQEETVLTSTARQYRLRLETTW